MKNIYIQNWFGRLGNNILQIKNALHIAISKSYNVILPPHPFFNTKYIQLNSSISPLYQKITDEFYFYYKEKLPFPPHIFEENLDSVLKILQSIFIYPPPISLDSNDCVIHIRSGDIFSSCPHPGYITPPLSYYTNILNSNSFNTIYLIAEDSLNPCIPKLLDIYPNIQFKIQSLEKDIQYILAAHTVIISYGTMINSLLLLSKYIKNIYMPSYNFPLFLNNINIQLIELNEYKQILSPWKNTTEQQALMLSYSLD